MTRLFKQLSTGAAAVLVLGTGSFSFAQPPPGGRHGSPMYDVKTETTITGAVESVETITGEAARGHRGLGGTHLVVKTATETLEVHVGPTAYLTEKKIALTKGDAVEVLGSRVTVDGKPVLVARQIKKGSDTWTLRDTSGRPLWSGGRR
jgi:hypothetical protein